MAGDTGGRGSKGASGREPRRHIADIERIALVAHHAIHKTPPHSVGHVKLNLILWHVDLEHYRRFGSSMTGLKEYVRGPHGPLSWSIVAAVAGLVRQRRVSDSATVRNGISGRELASLQSPADLADLTADQAGIIDRMIQALAPLTAHQLLSMFQADPLWRETRPGSAMVISTGAIVTRSGAVPREPRAATEL